MSRVSFLNALPRDVREPETDFIPSSETVRRRAAAHADGQGIAAAAVSAPIVHQAGARRAAGRWQTKGAAWVLPAVADPGSTSCAARATRTQSLMCCSPMARSAA